jgi:phosphoglycerate dehydrogenase-like enzyme
MKTKRILLDSELAPLVQDLLQGAGLDTDVITPRKDLLEPLLAHGGYAALLLQSKTPVPLSVLETAGKGLKVIVIVGGFMGNINMADASHHGILLKVNDFADAYEAGKTLGLIGCGRVAQSLALEIRPYCERIIGYDNDLRTVFETFHRRSPLERPVIEYCQLSGVLEYADLISIHTDGLVMVFKGAELYYARKRPYIVNTARCGHMGEQALPEALKQNRVREAALSVPVDQIRMDEPPPLWHKRKAHDRWITRNLRSP